MSHGLSKKLQAHLRDIVKAKEMLDFHQARAGQFCNELDELCNDDICRQLKDVEVQIGGYVVSLSQESNSLIIKEAKPRVTLSREADNGSN